ncbi:hypothetical protein E2562_028305 [Oryza meyeriana var. granulata]|uniref:Uncharacterized protein n=1 Tax=Oryza meyeriana var. granulata TaxID=110450 RepID=A0A6G1E339_9ORYZ|nr:hypothetical protein E2562_028305 [Oryza meyeriana var. granulata]
MGHHLTDTRRAALTTSILSPLSTSLRLLTLAFPFLHSGGTRGSVRLAGGHREQEAAPAARAKGRRGDKGAAAARAGTRGYINTD